MKGKKLTTEEIKQIRTLAKTLSYKDVSKQTGLSFGSVQRYGRGSKAPLRGKKNPNFKHGAYCRDKKGNLKNRVLWRRLERDKLRKKRNIQGVPFIYRIKRQKARLSPPATDKLFNRKIKLKCPVCKKMYECFPSKITKSCSRSCAGKLSYSNRKKNTKGQFI